MANSKSLRREIEQLVAESIFSTIGGIALGNGLDSIGWLSETPSLLSCVTWGWIGYQSIKFIAPRWYRAWRNGQRTTAMQLPVEEYEPEYYSNGKPMNNSAIAAVKARNQQSTFQHTMTLISQALHTRRNYGTMGQTYNEQEARSKQAVKHLPLLWATYKGVPYQFTAIEIADFLDEAIKRQRAGSKPFPKSHWTVKRKPRMEQERYYAMMEWVKAHHCTVDRIGNKTGRLNSQVAAQVLRSLERYGRE